MRHDMTHVMWVDHVNTVDMTDIKSDEESLVNCCTGLGMSVQTQRSMPTILLDHVSQFNDKLALFVLLTGLESMFLVIRTRDV